MYRKSLESFSGYNQLSNIHYRGQDNPRQEPQYIIKSQAELSQKIILKNGLRDVEYVLGHQYFKEGEYKKSAEVFEKAVEKGNIQALFGLGCLYFFGKGVTQNYQKGIELWENAAEKGVAEADFALGELYYYGKGAPQDYNRSAEWFRKASDKGHLKAMVYLGAFYAEGYGVTRDHDKSFECLTRAIENGLNAGSRDVNKYMNILADIGHKGAQEWLKNSSKDF